MPPSIFDLEVGATVQGKPFMPGISDEKVVLTLIEKRQPKKGDKFVGTFMGIEIGRFVAERKGATGVIWRRESKPPKGSQS